MVAANDSLIRYSNRGLKIITSCGRLYSWRPHPTGHLQVVRRCSTDALLKALDHGKASWKQRWCSTGMQQKCTRSADMCCHSWGLTSETRPRMSLRSLMRSPATQAKHQALAAEDASTEALVHAAE